MNIDIHQAMQYLLILILGIAIFLSGVFLRALSSRIDVLSSRIQNIEIQLKETTP